MYRHSTINIPISLCVAAVRNGLTGQLSLYCFLKAMGDGTIINPTTLCLAFCKAKACSKSSFYSWLNWLIDNKWIYKVSDHVFVVISFSNLIKNTGIPIQSNRSCIFYLTDLHQFKGFICAAIITYFGKLKANRDAFVGAKKGRALSGKCHPGLSLPILYLAKAMNVSKSTAQGYFHAAKTFITFKQQFEVIECHAQYANVIRKYSGIKPNSVVINNSKVSIQKSNLFFSQIVIHKMKSISIFYCSKNPYRIKGRL